MNKRALKCIFADWVRQTIDSWKHEYTAWDEYVKEGVLTDEELTWIMENLDLGEIEIVEVGEDE